MIIDGGVNDARIIGSVAMVLILLLAIVGMDWVTRVSPTSVRSSVRQSRWTGSESGRRASHRVGQSLGTQHRRDGAKCTPLITAR